MSRGFQKTSAIALAAGYSTDLLNTGKIHLFKNNIAPNDDTVLGDLIEADYNGYTAGGVAVATWPPPYWLSDDGLVHTTTTHQFQATDGVNPNIIYGYYVTDKNGLLVYAANLGVPFNMADAFSALILDADVAFGV